MFFLNCFKVVFFNFYLLNNKYKFKCSFIISSTPELNVRCFLMISLSLRDGNISTLSNIDALHLGLLLDISRTYRMIKLQGLIIISSTQRLHCISITIDLPHLFWSQCAIVPQYAFVSLVRPFSFFAFRSLLIFNVFYASVF